MDQGRNVVNACEALGVPVIKCNCHRVNSAVLWALGIAGKGRKNKDMGELMKKLAALVGVFRHYAVTGWRTTSTNCSSSSAETTRGDL